MLLSRLVLGLQAPEQQPSDSSVEVMQNPFTLHPQMAPPELEVFLNGGSSWMEVQAALNSRQDGPNRKKPSCLQHCIQGVQQIHADEDLPWILEQGKHYHILTPGQRRTVVCCGDIVLKFTDSRGHGQEVDISAALGCWAAKVFRHCRVPIAIGDGVYYLDLLQQEIVRLLNVEFMGVEGPSAEYWALLLFALCWLAPSFIAADSGMSNMGVMAVYDLPVPVFFDLETWRPNHSRSWRHQRRRIVETHVQG